ncbi:hypothetical protein JCM8097_004256 [Rhodosporidiobolus ruineniae]
MSRKSRPPPPLPKRTRSLSASSAQPSPLSPAYRLADQYLSLVDDMQAFSLDREQRTATLKQAQSQADKLAAQVAQLRRQLVAAPQDLSLRIKLLEVEGDWRRAYEREKAAAATLNSPSIVGPPAPHLSSLRSPYAGPPLFPPSPPRIPSPTPRSRPLSLYSSNRPPSPTFSASTASRPPSPSLRPRRISISSAHSPAWTSASPRAFSPAPLPPSAVVPQSDPLPALGHTLPDHSVLVTSRTAVPGCLITRELGIVQAVAPSSTDLGGLKERLRVEGEKRGAHAVVGVRTEVWAGEGGGLAGSGRAVRLRKM